MDTWEKVEDSKIETGLIYTLHEDGKEDICRVVNGEIYAYDPKTFSPITHVKHCPSPFIIGQQHLIT